MSVQCQKCDRCTLFCYTFAKVTQIKEYHLPAGITLAFVTTATTVPGIMYSFPHEPVTALSAAFLSGAGYHGNGPALGQLQ